MNPSHCLFDPHRRMHSPTPDVDPEPSVPPDGTPRPIGDPPGRTPPEHLR
ncbi:hypothetical protein AWB78_07475 [Caballeronia calidae]|uniref:Uncharacterized protein n=1 Tax=Caballeronia calidae TaxID=1777139 RepID=A0A158EET2_9BURK|nr:hypothetical protein [Caballeronia calidae]SAL05399.1 hypothetical protein AWB78_07475 [Caballeronia calidae]